MLSVEELIFAGVLVAIFVIGLVAALLVAWHLKSPGQGDE